MIASLKSELRKLYTIRSTYVIAAFAFILMLIFVFYTEGMKAGISSAPLTDPYKLANVIRDAITNLTILGAIVGILLFTHEYRYNTISYTLVSARRRTHVILSKIFAISIFSVVFTAFIVVSTIVMLYAGLSIKSMDMVSQTIPSGMWWQIIFAMWGACMAGLLFAAIIRQQVAAIIAYFVIPGIVEQLLGVLLKANVVYLPFMALRQVTFGSEGIPENIKALSPSKAAVVFLIYLSIGWIIAWILFKKRDAS